MTSATAPRPRRPLWLRAIIAVGIGVATFIALLVGLAIAMGGRK